MSNISCAPRQRGTLSSSLLRVDMGESRLLVLHDILHEHVLQHCMFRIPTLVWMPVPSPTDCRHGSPESIHVPAFSREMFRHHPFGNFSYQVCAVLLRRSSRSLTVVFVTMQRGLRTFFWEFLGDGALSKQASSSFRWHLGPTSILSLFVSPLHVDLTFQVG